MIEIKKIDSYQTHENIDRVKNKKQIDKNIIKKAAMMPSFRCHSRKCRIKRVCNNLEVSFIADKFEW